MQTQVVNLGALLGWKNYRKFRVLLHVAVWVLYIFIYAFIYALFYQSTTLGKALTQYTITAWIDVSAAYLLVRFLIPRYLLKRRFAGFFTWFLAVSVLAILLQRVILLYITIPLIYAEDASKYPFFKFNYLYSFFNIWVMPVFFASVKLFEYWLADQKQNQELRQQKLESELKFLKSQIHPHFLFNTLNNLYALTLDKSDKAPEVVVKLSDLLSYMLYECNVPRVPLEKEISLLRDYLELEKMRYQTELKVHFDVEGRVNGKMIAPLLLIPFIENGFKHGLSKQIENPWINIHLEVEDYKLAFTVENNKPLVDKKDDSGYSEGIGLKNVKRRLDLIYGEGYNLQVADNNGIFKVKLQLILDGGTKHQQAKKK